MQNERLSLLIDGEQIDDELILELSNNKALQQKWHNYHIIRETLRGSLNEATVRLDIAQQIALAIEKEEMEPVVAHAHTIKESQPESSRWIKFPFWNKISPLLTPVTQVGVAACAALVVILGVQQFNHPVDGIDVTPSLNTVPIGVNVAPVGYNGNAYFKSSSDLQQQEKNKIRVMLQDYEQQRRIEVGE